MIFTKLTLKKVHIFIIFAHFSAFTLTQYAYITYRHSTQSGRVSVISLDGTSQFNTHSLSSSTKPYDQPGTRNILAEQWMEIVLLYINNFDIFRIFLKYKNHDKIPPVATLWSQRFVRILSNIIFTQPQFVSLITSKLIW